MKKDLKYLIVIFLFSLFYFFVMPNYFIGDDSLFHTSNIIANAKTNTILVSKILPLIEENLGYGVNIFYPPLPHLIGSYIYRIINNIEITMQILQFISIFLAGVSMYYYVKIVFNNQKQALLTSMCYMSSPYLITDVFTRTALNESFLFYILPIIFLGLHYLKENNLKYYYIFFIIGFTLSIYTHLVLSVYIAIISCIYLIYNYKKIKLLPLIKASIIISGLTSPFLIPLLEHYFLNNYYIFHVSYTVGKNFNTLSALIYIFPSIFKSGARNILRFHQSPIALLLLINIYFLSWKKEITKKERKVLLLYVIILLISILFASNKQVWLIVPNLLKNIQFPWRLSLFTSFTFSVVVGYGIKLWKKNKKYLLIITTILLLITNMYYLSQIEIVDHEKQLLNTNATENKSWQKEYLPEESINNRLRLGEKYLMLESDKNIKIIKNNVPNLTLEIKKIKKVELPRIYYLGYVLKDKNNKTIKLKKSINGLLEADIKEKGKYYLTYQGTILSKISFFIAAISIIFYIKMIRK